MSTKAHGTTTTCGECCTRLLEYDAGVKRHLYILETLAQHRASLLDPSITSPRTTAWGKVYGGTKFKAPVAARRLGFGRPRPGDSKDAWQAAHDSFLWHQKTVSQEIVDRQAAAERELLEIVRGIGRVDIADFFDLEEENDDGADVVLTKIIKWIHEGVQGKTTKKPLENHDLLGSGVRLDYKGRQRPPRKAELFALFRRCTGDQLKPMRQLREEGLSKYIASWVRERDAVKFTILYKEAFKLEAAMTGQISTTLNINDAKAAQDVWEEAFKESLGLLAAPELVEPALAGAVWLCNEPVQLVPGEGKVTRAAGETLRWTGERWVVEGYGHLRLAGGKS